MTSSRPNNNKNENDKKDQSLLQKVISRSAPLDKTEALEALYWLKQIVGLIMGVVCGVVPFMGATGIALFLITAAALSHILAFFYLKVDENEVGLSAALTEGGMTALAMFLLTWIVTFTVFHHSELLMQ